MSLNSLCIEITQVTIYQLYLHSSEKEKTRSIFLCYNTELGKDTTRSPVPF